MVHNLKRILTEIVPTRKQVVLFILLSIATLVSVYYNLVIARILQNLPISRQELSLLFDSYSNYFSQLGQSQLTYYIVIALFWSGVGIMAYLAIWVIINLLMELRNFIVYETSYVHKARLEDRLKTVSIRLSLAAGVIAIIIITVVYGLPLWFTLFSSGLFAPLLPGLVVLLSVSLLGLAANLYILWVSIKLFHRANP